MNSERWQQVDNLFHSALECTSEERSRFLDGACAGDEVLHGQVNSMLSAYENADSFIECPAVEYEARQLANDEQFRPEMAEGEIISHYQIVAPIAAGGMGEVYLAQDLMLGRKVALKILPDYLTDDPERLRRFEQEAHAASALSHPNIITVYEIGQTESTHFIVTEYIDGATLRDHLRGKPLEMTEALDIALQVASALAVAHAKGIIHRDVKPENIMIAHDNPLAEEQRYIKLVDFGIAKLTEPDITDTEVETLAHTGQGLAIGTAPYMSPEQAQGLPVDARTDIWSLGVVIYEMLTGRFPFEGPTVHHVILAILEQDPVPFSTYVPAVPGPLEWLVMKALRKDREERHQTAKELFGDLKHLKEALRAGSEVGPLRESQSGVLLSQQGRGETSSPPDSKSAIVDHPVILSRSDVGVEYFRHGRIFLAALAALGLALVGVFGIWKYSGLARRGNNTAVPFGKMTVKRLTTNGMANSVAISPDGKYLVHAMGSPGQQSLWLRHIATQSDKEIVASDGSGLSNVTFSPDGNHVYFLKSSPEKLLLIEVPVLGGKAKEVVSDVDSTVSFSPDGNSFAFVRGDPTTAEASLIVAKSDSTGEQKIVTHGIDEFFFPITSGAAWSPDGDRIAFGLRTETGDRHRSLFTVDLKNHEEKQITSGPWLTIEAIHWLPDGRGLVITASERARLNAQVWYVSYPSGDTRRITNDLNNYQNVSITADSASLVTVLSHRTSDIWTAPAGDSDAARQITYNRSDGDGGVAWTPDGKIVHVSTAGDDADIYIMDEDGTDDRRLTSDTGNKYGLTVSRDSRYIVYSSDRTGSPNIWRLDVDGRNAKQLTSSRSDLYPMCSADNKWVIFTSNRSGRLTLWKVPMDGGNAIQLTEYLSVGSAISPRDGSILFRFIDEESQPRRWRRAVVGYEGGQPTKAFDLPQFFGVVGASLRVSWTVDGRWLTYVDTRSGVSNIWAQPVGGGPSKQLTRFKSDLIFSYDWSPDGKRLALARGTQTSDVVLMKDVTGTR